MSGFKLIGIRPHEDCEQSFIKMLKPGQLYQFYHGVQFCDENGNSINDSNSKSIVAFKEFKPLQKIADYHLNDEFIRKIIKDHINQTTDDLYRIGKLSVNTSAIVGRNGSGKSSLLDSILYATYVLAFSTKSDNDKSILKPYHTILEQQVKTKQKRIKVYQEKIKDHEINIGKDYSIKHYSKDIIKDHTPEEYSDEWRFQNIISLLNSIQQERLSIKKIKEEIKDSRKEHRGIIQGFKCSIFYQLNDEVYELYISNKKRTEFKRVPLAKGVKQIQSLRIVPKDLQEKYFYSLFLNYSHHSLNSKNLGYWINTLFHKNDGYKTPLVINPMRVKGNIDINNEIHLSKTRLLVNLLTQRFIEKKAGRKQSLKISENQKVECISFQYFKPVDFVPAIELSNNNLDIKINDTSTERIILYNIARQFIDTNFIQKPQSIYDFYGNKVLFTNPLIDYIIFKIQRISENYPEYSPSKDPFNDETTEINYYAKLIDRLSEDTTHVTFKYHRVKYFIQKIIKQGKRFKWKKEDEQVYFSLDSLLDWMEIKTEQDLFEINRRLPPSIFNIEFHLVNNDEKKKFDLKSEKDIKAIKSLPKFSDLSSGEQHYLHTINSVIYHLNNAYSVHKTNLEISRLTYENFNLIFDEIELYFHPDLQRKFISSLLQTLESHSHLVDGEFIKNLNILFSTHSPFILSDIPSQNILQLDVVNGYSNPTKLRIQSFGANIHELLANPFFMSGNYRGEFAQKYLASLIDEIALMEKSKEIQFDKLRELVIKATIISEPIIKNKLFEKLFFINENNSAQ